MPNNKVKSLKKLGKVESVHPFSRKAKQARRAMLRDDRLAKVKSERETLHNSPLVDRYMFIKHAMDPEFTSFSPAQVHEIVDLWLGRHDEDLEEMRAERARVVHSKKSPREDLMEAMIRNERAEYAAHGVVMPNLESGKVVLALRNWDGDLNGLDQMKTVLVRPPKASASATSAPTPSAPKTAQEMLAEITGMTVDQ
ncbi:hypothetical protein BC828DRAFT_393611 [Blastocladiella britannica]|nr:hypothetical protein BC828DRAFT_393611 [Blastocladiella britannica]